MDYYTKLSPKVSLVFLVVIFLAILFFGLNPKDFSFSNHVDWIKDQAGLHFNKYGMAYTDFFIEKMPDGSSESMNFSVEIALKLKKPDEDRFRFIFVLHDGQDSRQLVMAQWRSWIIFMNGDDYANKRKTKRLSVDTALLPAGPLFLTVTTGSHGTNLYCAGKLVEEKNDLTLDVPTGREARLVLGNSAYGTHSWEGDVYGLAFYRSAITDHDIAMHFNRWSKERNFAFATPDKPFMLFLFDEKEGRWAFDHSGGNHPLSIPKRMKTWERNLLVPPWQGLEFNRSSMMVDIVLNVLGFIPLGFFLSAVLTGLGGNFKKQGVFITVGLCLAASLFIEIVQAWVPSRSSSASDLILNVFGGWIGSITYKLFPMRT